MIDIVDLAIKIQYPLVIYCNRPMGNHHRNSDFSHDKWWFSMFFCMFTRPGRSNSKAHIETSGRGSRKIFGGHRKDGTSTSTFNSNIYIYMDKVEKMEILFLFYFWGGTIYIYIWQCVKTLYPWWTSKKLVILYNIYIYIHVYMYEFRLQVIKAGVVSEVARRDEMKRSSFRPGSEAGGICRS